MTTKLTTFFGRLSIWVKGPEIVTLTIKPRDYINVGDILHIGPFGSAGYRLLRVLRLEGDYTVIAKPVRAHVRFLCWIEDKMGRRLWFKF